MSNCENCPVHNTGNLVRLGINMDKFDYLVALAGNPNTGKSTVFNNLTGLKQHTGNWPGKTVTRAEGGYIYNEKRFKIVDLPGTYSLLSTSEDEEVARDFVLFGQPDVTIVVVDATRLERNLNLVLQINEITDRAVLCLNLMDEARRYEYEIDVRSLSRDLGIPVVPTEARHKKGMDELLEAVYEVASGNYICKPHKVISVPSNVKKILDDLTKEIQEEFPNLPNARWVAMRLLEGDQTILDSIRSGELNTVIKSQSTVAAEEGIAV